MSVVTDAPSIRRRLLALLLIPTAAIAAVATYYDYRTASTLFEAGYDRALLDAALAISSNIQARDGEQPRLALTPDAVTMLRTDSLDQIYYRVSAGDGRFIAGDADLPVLHQRVGNPTFGHARYRGERIRIASYRVMTGGAASIVTVAETLHKRNAARQRVLQSSLAVDAAQLAAALLVIWLGVRLAIAPLRAVEQDLAGRRPRDLEAFSTAQVPVELRSLIEALNRLMEALAESQAAERSFLENAAHQLRTPLAGMLAQLELLAAPGAEISGARIQAALTSGRRLARTAQQLLALARSEAAARTATDLDRVWLPAAIETCVGVHLPAADAARLDLGAQVEAAEILGLPWLIEEALGNLVDNAIAATPPGGSVTLRCGTLEGHAFVEVCDTGVGIPAAERAQVFQRFYRASNARVPGSGLGLAIVHEVARMHGAKLELAAGDGERGMVVRMTFP
jgi:two-component system, OmpR family, sensor histidine kinase TctE